MSTKSLNEILKRYNKHMHTNCIIPLMKKIIMNIREERFHNIDVPNDCDDDCEFLTEIKDSFNTNDSPSEFECVCTNYEECPIIEEFS